MNHRNSILSFSENWQLLRLLQSSLHKVRLKNLLPSSIDNSWANYICFEIFLSSSSGQAQCFDTFDLFISWVWPSEMVIFVSESYVCLFFLSLFLSRWFSSFLFRIWFLNWILISLFLVALFLFFKLGFGPCHNIRNTNQCLLLLIVTNFQSRNCGLNLLEIASIQVIDNYIRIEENILKKLNFLGLNYFPYSIWNCTKRLICCFVRNGADNSIWIFRMLIIISKSADDYMPKMSIERWYEIFSWSIWDGFRFGLLLVLLHFMWLLWVYLSVWKL